jgi:hypothetical protein
MDPQSRTVDQVMARIAHRQHGLATRPACSCSGRASVRTLVDLAAVLPLDALARACHEAGVNYSAAARSSRRSARCCSRSLSSSARTNR